MSEFFPNLMLYLMTICFSFVQVDLGSVMASRGGVYRASIFKPHKYGDKPRGTVRITGEPLASNIDTLNIQFAALKLRNMDGLFQKSDPFITIDRQNLGVEGGSEGGDGHHDAHIARPTKFSKQRRTVQKAAFRRDALLEKHGSTSGGTPAAFNPKLSWTQVTNRCCCC
tara:strand:- start:72 stop:578 length:507 start_codon:yes stop_codon:yes gene_type:complete